MLLEFLVRYAQQSTRGGSPARAQWVLNAQLAGEGLQIRRSAGLLAKWPPDKSAGWRLGIVTVNCPEHDFEEFRCCVTIEVLFRLFVAKLEVRLTRCV